MTRTIVAIAVAVVALPAAAVAENPPPFDRTVVWGPRWSPGMSFPDNDAEPFFAFSGGGAAVVRVSELVSVQAEAFYSIRSWSRRDPTPDVTEQIVALTYLDLPLHARLHYPVSDRVRLALLLGGYAGIFLFGVDRKEHRDDRIVSEMLPGSELRRFLPAASGGLAAELDFSRLLFTLEGRVVHSLQSVGDSSGSPSLTTVGLMIGLLF